ncbi:MAG: toprim domain-containing protein [Gammaproteobacteria bacterium]|nr:toprim domain-containing protein [Gammaproteobacteria bacterium]
MARIPDDQIDRLKTEVSLQRLAEGMGITMKRHGADLIGLCPFHDDKEPSLVITPKQNLWHCLGACQTGGSVIDWVMKAEGVSFRHATELLLSDYSPSLVAGSAPVKQATVRKLPTALEHNAENAKLLRQVMDYYHEALKQSPEAQAYLEKRGLSVEAIDHFKIGFANRSLGYRLPAKNRKEGAAIRGQLQRLGLYRASGHEHFSGSIVIPVVDEAGQITEVYGRKINDNLRKGTPKHLYLPGAHVGVWNVEALAASPEIILCESLIDALTFWCAGYRNVTCSYGTEGFITDHLAAFKKYGTERVLIAYDRDEAGNKAADKLAKQLTSEGIDVYRLQFPKGMDANEYAMQVQPASKSLGVVIRSAEWLGNGKAKTITTGQAVLVEEVESMSVAADEAEVAQVSEVNEISEPSPSLAAAVVPSAPKIDITAEIKENEIIIPLGGRNYRIRGLDKNLSYEQMKVNLLASGSGLDGEEAVHVDTLDLYQSRPRSAFIKQAASELGVKEDVIKRDLGKVLLKLEALQEERIQAAQEPNEKVITLTDDESEAALSLLRSPDLLNQILADFESCGVVGESTNILTGYLACVSRKLDDPLAVLIQSTSAAGKSALMDAILDLMPEEERIQYSAMTGQSLFYLGESDLKHKILAIAEEEGVSEAAYALKLLQSQGELTIASTGKDPVSGKLVTQEYRVEGPVMIFLTTTAIELDEELLNRCLVLTVNESREQTQAIQERQRYEETLEGLLASQTRTDILALHRNAQRLLKPLKVVNPYADRLTFLSDKTRTRRDHRKYLALIRTITLLHQYQRPTKQVAHSGQMLEYIEVTLEDIETANRLAHEVLGRTLDELPPQTRSLLKLIHEMVAARCKSLDMHRSDFRFSRRDVRECCQWSDTALKVHMARLVELEYLLAHRGGRGQSYAYELLYLGEGEQGDAFLMGLLDVQKLQYDAKWSGQNGKRSGSGEPQVGGKSGGSQSGKNGCKPSSGKACDTTVEDEPEKAQIRVKNRASSHRTHKPALVAQSAE